MGLVAASMLSSVGCGSTDAVNPRTSSIDAGGGGISEGAGANRGAVSRTGEDGCPVGSGFDGDDACLVAPVAEAGVQLHFGPKDYDDADEVSKFVVAPGSEVNWCYFTKLPNQTDLVYGQRHGSMRPGSHHFIARALADLDMPTGFADCKGADAVGNADDIGSFQIRSYTYPPAAPDYAGLANTLPAGRQGMLNGHFINQTEKPILAEAWLNYDKVDPVGVTHAIMPIALTGGLGMRIAPHMQTKLHFSCSPDQEIRVLELESHFHAHTQRMSAWKVDTSGARTLVYEGFDWREPAHFNFDLATVNPPSDRTSSRAGAISGPLTVSPKEAIEWECEIDNTSDGVLTFRNEVNTGEMCILSGAAAAVTGDTKPFGCNRN
jgi:hypothetical protein